MRAVLHPRSPVRACGKPRTQVVPHYRTRRSGAKAGDLTLKPCSYKTEKRARPRFTGHETWTGAAPRSLSTSFTRTGESWTSAYVDRVARQHAISLRTGCFCNPGAGEVAFTISRETLVGGEFGDGMSLDDYIDAIGLPSGGA